MEELEPIKEAKSHLEQLAKGINPITGLPMGQNGIFGQEECSCWFTHVAEILGKVVDKEAVEEGAKVLPEETKQPPTSQEELVLKRVYRHFKGNLYYVHDLVIHTETREEMVSYQALYHPYGMFVRPKQMFLEEIDPKKEGNVTGQCQRFELFHPPQQ